MDLGPCSHLTNPPNSTQENKRRRFTSVMGVNCSCFSLCKVLGGTRKVEKQSSSSAFFVGKAKASYLVRICEIELRNHFNNNNSKIKQIMKTIKFLLASLFVMIGMAAQAQKVVLYKDGKVIDTFEHHQVDEIVYNPDRKMSAISGAELAPTYELQSNTDAYALIKNAGTVTPSTAKVEWGVVTKPDVEPESWTTDAKSIKATVWGTYYVWVKVTPQNDTDKYGASTRCLGSVSVKPFESIYGYYSFRITDTVPMNILTNIDNLTPDDFIPLNELISEPICGVRCMPIVLLEATNTNAPIIRYFSLFKGDYIEPMTMANSKGYANSFIINGKEYNAWFVIGGTGATDTSKVKITITQ